MTKFSGYSSSTWEWSLLSERLPKLDFYKKASITGGLLKKGIVNDLIFQENGGLSSEQYTYFRNKLLIRRKVAQEIVNDVPSKDFSGRNHLQDLNQDKNLVLGDRKVLVLLVEFDDRTHKTDLEYFKKLLFSKGNHFSMRDYFWEVSGGKLNIRGEVIDWQTLDSYSNYLKYFGTNGKTWKGPDSQNIVLDALKQANNDKYFSDMDIRSFDSIILVVAGEGSNRTLNSTDISPHRSVLQTPFKISGKQWNSYIMINELPEYDLGGFCHEFAHFLGVPDLYMDDGSSMVVGKWCLMGAGSYNDDGRKPAHLSAWCKFKLGWAQTLKVEGSPILYEIPAVNGYGYGIENNEDINLIYKMDVPYSDGKEYFLVENRQQTGFDSHLPANGILIWHVDEDGFIRGSPNFDNRHLSLTLEQSDNKKELEKPINSSNFFEMISGKIGGDGGDVFPGINSNRRFNFSSKPNSNSYSGKQSNVTIDSISDSGDVMTAVMGYGSDKLIGDVEIVSGVKLGEGEIEGGCLTSVRVESEEYLQLTDDDMIKMKILWYILD